MRNDENACIRYLMKEMDPSEEVLMERAMMEDEDLLIEVESMRKTLGRLDEMPDKRPSPQLTESIVSQAAEHREELLSSTLEMMPLLRYTAAAVVLIGMSFGAFYAYDFLAVSADRTSVGASQPSLDGSASAASAGQNVPRVTPWVDRNDILHLDQTVNGTNQAFDSIFRSATQKLRPINDSFFNTSPNRSLQLTNSAGN